MVIKRCILFGEHISDYRLDEDLCENVSCLQMGAYHTIDLELNRKFTLLKEHWDLIALDRVGKHGV